MNTSVHKSKQGLDSTFSYTFKSFHGSHAKGLDVMLRKKCPYSEFFWPIFSFFRTEYGDILNISPYSARMRENRSRETDVDMKDGDWVVDIAKCQLQ